LSNMRLCSSAGQVETIQLPRQSELLPNTRLIFHCPIGYASSVYILMRSYGNNDTCHYMFQIESKLISVILSGPPFCMSESPADVAKFAIDIIRDFGISVNGQ
jgi:hypothetical protein